LLGVLELEGVFLAVTLPVLLAVGLAGKEDKTVGEGEGVRVADPVMLGLSLGDCVPAQEAWLQVEVPVPESLLVGVPLQLLL
jgi:hypothetical protein